MKQSTKRAIKKYGKATCISAHTLSMLGYGASGVAIELGMTHPNAADSAINAGAELFAIRENQKEQIA